MTHKLDMVRQSIGKTLELILENFRDAILKHETIAPDKILLHVDSRYLKNLTEYLLHSLKARYCTSAGVDERPLSGDFKIYHIFSLDADKAFIMLSVRASPITLKLPSITPSIPGAEWAEREIRDLLGIEFEGHPNPRRLVLPDDWPTGVFPLRKDFKYNLKDVPSKTSEQMFRAPSKSEYVVPIGPYHPALHEPEYFKIYVSKGRIVDAKYRGFGVFRGIEKLAEGKLKYNQIPFIAERICGICGFTHSSCYCQAVETASGIEVPERAQYIRAIMLELERIHSHLLWLGVACHLLGFDTGFMHCWRIREKVMDLCEMITGNRKTYGLNLVGGVRRDINEKAKTKIMEFIEKMHEELKEFTDVLLSMGEIINRVKDVGILSKEDARKLCVVGPVARASGIKIDSRVDHPYFAYKELSFNIPIYSEGDTLARLMVRVDELHASAEIVEQALDKLPKGELMAEEVDIPANVKGLAVTEAPRGENVHFVITGVENRIYRWKVRAPTYNNLPALPCILKGESLADAPIIIASIDPCFSCTDRITVINMETGKLMSNPFKWR